MSTEEMQSKEARDRARQCEATIARINPDGQPVCYFLAALTRRAFGCVGERCDHYRALLAIARRGER